MTEYKKNRLGVYVLFRIGRIEEQEGRKCKSYLLGLEQGLAPLLFLKSQCLGVSDMGRRGVRREPPCFSVFIVLGFYIPLDSD